MVQSVARRYHRDTMASHDTEVSRLLGAWNRGEPEALETLMPLVVDDLRSIARRYFEREEASHTLQPTALVNELYLWLDGRRRVRWQGPSHFFGAAAQIMRRLLVDYARYRQAAKRGGGAPRVPLDDDLSITGGRDPEEILALEEALKRLERLEPRQGEIVALKSFAGLTLAEIAETLGVGQTAVKRDLRFARAWLERELRRGDG